MAYYLVTRSNTQYHIHIKNGNVRVASRNYDDSVHDKKYKKIMCHLKKCIMLY